MDKMKHVVIRSKSAGVFVGEIESKDGQREVPEITIFEVIEIIPMTDKAVKSIKAVPVWES